MYKRRAGWLFLSVILCVVGYTLTANNDSWINKKLHKYAGLKTFTSAIYENKDKTVMSSVEEVPVHVSNQDHDKTDSSLPVSDNVHIEKDDVKDFLDDLENNEESLTEAQIDDMLHYLETAADSIYNDEKLLVYDTEKADVSSLSSVALVNKESSSVSDKEEENTTDIDVVIITQDENTDNEDNRSISTTSSKDDFNTVDTIIQCDEDKQNNSTTEENPTTVVDEIS